MTTRIAGLTYATLPTAPSVCHECIWWQSREGRTVDKRRWIHDTEDAWGAWGSVYYDDDRRLLGSMQYGPSECFPRAAELPAGPPSDDAILVTCAYLTDSSKPWVMQSLFLTAIGDARDKGARALEAFAYAYTEGESGSRASSWAASSPSPRARARRSCASSARRSSQHRRRSGRSPATCRSAARSGAGRRSWRA